MKKILIAVLALATLSMTSCTNNYSNGNRVGAITSFQKTGQWFKSYEGHLNVTQTGMNSSTGFDFSIDNDNEPIGLVEKLDSAQNFGWKVELKYHQVNGFNLFNNRGHTDFFVTECKVLDRNFNSIFTNNGNQSTSTNSVVSKDTLITITLTYDEARKLGWFK